MCGGYTVTKSIDKLEKRFNAKFKGASFGPRYNARPSQNLPIILNTDKGNIILAHWGLKPHWEKEKGAKEIINARAESYGKPTFQKAFLERRCLVPADGFYEWVKTPKGKQPFYFKLKSWELFAFAGIYDADKEKEGMFRYSIITTEPNKMISLVHDRMPVILNPKNELSWLDKELPIEEILKILVPYPDSTMTFDPVSKKVSSPLFDSEDLVMPIVLNSKTIVPYQ